MQSKGSIVVGFGLCALFVACGEGSQTASKSSSATQSDNGTTTDVRVKACTDVTGQQLGGFMTMDAPRMNGSFLPHGAAPPAPPPLTDVAPSCENPLSMPPTTAGNDFHYQSYTFANDGDAAACVSVEFDLGFIKNGPTLEELAGIETLAYLDHFDPTDIEKNYIAGYYGLQFGNGVPAPNNADFASAAAGIMAAFSFTVPAHRKFVVVVGGKEKPPQDVPAGQFALYFPYVLDVTNCHGSKDAGPSEPDAGSSTPDAGSSTPDAGSSTPDAGSSTPDAGSSSGGSDPTL